MTLSERSMDLLWIFLGDLSNLRISAGESVRRLLNKGGKEEFDDDIHSEHTSLLPDEK